MRTHIVKEFKLIAGVETPDGKVEFICWTILNARLTPGTGRITVTPESPYEPFAGDEVGQVVDEIKELLADRDRIDRDDEPAMCGMEAREIDLGTRVFDLASKLVVGGGFPTGTKTALISFVIGDGPHKALVGTRGVAEDLSHLMDTLAGRKFLHRFHSNLMDGVERPKEIPQGVWTRG